MKSVRIVNVPGYKSGEVKSFPDNKAITYCQNGQAEPVGWSPDKHGAREEPKAGEPMNRMLDTGSEKVKAKRQKDAD